jgi:tetratricopeptide (TPR) repeat protein
MAKGNVFSTPRENTLTADQMLQGKINARNVQRQNIIALTEAHRLENQTPDFTAAMEAANQATEKNLQVSAAMESAAYKHGSRNIAKDQLGMKQRLVQEGMSYVPRKVLYELIYESYWLDDEVKDATAEQIGDSIDSVLGYIEESCKESEVEEGEWSPLLKSMKRVIEATVSKAADRICEEAEENGEAYNEFELTDAEEDELDNKLVDLGRDELVDLIKTKVADVVQDEKAEGEKRAEMFKEIDEMSQDDGSDDQTTETEESLAAKLANGEITLEGANIESLKIYFSKLRSDGSKTLKEANKLYSSGQYKLAAERYKKAKDMFQDLNERLVDVDDSLVSTALSWTKISLVILELVSLIDTINARGFATMGDATKAHDETSSWNNIKRGCLANVKKVIRFCDSRIKTSERLADEEGGKKKKYKYSLDSTIYNANERYMASILESGADLRLFDDPTWGEFKSTISLLCKQIKQVLEGPDTVKCTDDESVPSCSKWQAAYHLIATLEDVLSDVPEDVPGEIKEFVMSMVNLIYAAIPLDEVLISRFNAPIGSPDFKSKYPVIDWMTISWTDILVNIKTNLNSIKGYLDNKINPEVIDKGDLNDSDCPVSGRNALSQMIARNQSQIIARNIGGSLFEAMMIGSLQSCSKAAMESKADVTDDDVNDAALIETLLNYTVFETLDTIGLYKFRMNDMKNIKRDFMNGVLEADVVASSDGSSMGSGNALATGITTPTGTAMSAGKDHKGLKKVRINVSRMKQKRDVMTSDKNTFSSDNRPSM